MLGKPFLPPSMAAIVNQQDKRAAMISDIADAMSNGFKAEPDLSPCHMPLLSTEALERVHAESEKWRKSSRERELEQQLQDMIEAEHRVSDYYLAIRGIIHALDVPAYFRAIDGSPAHIAWTEQKGRELVAMAEASEKHAEAAKDAERRVDLLERYVKACDEKRLPYNWNVFKMGTKTLCDLVWKHEGMEKLSRITDGAEKAAWFEERTKQEIDQDLRNANARIAELENIIGRARSAYLHATPATAATQMFVILGEFKSDEYAWLNWSFDFMPQGLAEDTTIEIQTKNGVYFTLSAGSVKWSWVAKYRRVK